MSRGRTPSTYYVKNMNAYGPPAPRRTGTTRTARCSRPGTARCGSMPPRPRATSIIPRRARSPTRPPSRRRPIQVTSNGSGWFWAWSLGDPGLVEEGRCGEVVREVGDLEGLHRDGRQRGRLGFRASRNAQVDLRQSRILRRRRRSRRWSTRRCQVPDITKPTKDPVPYIGIQYVAIPEFQGIGTAVGQQIAAALAGQVDRRSGARDGAALDRADDEAGGLSEIGRSRQPIAGGRRGNSPPAVPSSRED